VTALADSTDTSNALAIADIVISDDALGSNTISLTGVDAASFEVVGSELRLKAGTPLDYDTQDHYDVIVHVDDLAVGGSPDASIAHKLYITESNTAPTVSLTGVVTSLPENTDTSSSLTVADIVLTDDGVGINQFSLTGADASDFEIVGTELWLRAGTSLDFESQVGYSVAVSVDDSTIIGSPEDSDGFLMTVVNVNEAPAVALVNLVAALDENSDTTSGIRVADIVVADDALGTNSLSLTGANSADFEILGTQLRLRAGTVLDFEAQSSHDVIVQVDDSGVGGAPDDARLHTVNLNDVNEAPTVTLVNALTVLLDTTDTSTAVKIADLLVSDDALGSQTVALTGTDASLFEVVGTELRLRAGTTLNATAAPILSIVVTVDDATLPGAPDDSVSFALTVSSGNVAPTVSDDHFSARGGTLLSSTAPGVLGNDTDSNADPLSATLVSGTQHGTLVLLADGSFQYTPSTSFVGIDSFTYVAHDGLLDSSVSTVTIRVESSRRHYRRQSPIRRRRPRTIDHRRTSRPSKKLRHRRIRTRRTTRKNRHSKKPHLG
jgi:hypothetical protein